MLLFTYLHSAHLYSDQEIVEWPLVDKLYNITLALT